MTLMTREGAHVNFDAQDLRTYMAAHKESEYDLIDVRQPTEYDHGHIPGARLIPLNELEMRLDELAPAREHVFYCRSGARSRAAIALVQDSGLDLKAVYNLHGGIMGYAGRTLKGVPRVRMFDSGVSPAEALVQAMNMEKGAWTLYGRILEVLPGSPLAEAVTMLYGMEEAHARAVHHYLKKQVREEHLPAFEKMFAELPGDVIEGGESLDAVLAKAIGAGGAAPADCANLAELALELEYRAYDLYRGMSARATSVEAARAFLLLAEQEKAHMRVVAGMFKNCDGFGSVG